MDKAELFYRRRVLLVAVEELMGLMMLHQSNDLKAEMFKAEGLRVARRLAEVQDLIELAGYE